MTQDYRAETQALLTRAADLEARRQKAQRAGSAEQEQALTDELRQLWSKYSAIERKS